MKPANVLNFLIGSTLSLMPALAQGEVPSYQLEVWQVELPSSLESPATTLPAPGQAAVTGFAAGEVLAAIGDSARIPLNGLWQFESAEAFTLDFHEWGLELHGSATLTGAGVDMELVTVDRPTAGSPHCALSLPGDEPGGKALARDSAFPLPEGKALVVTALDRGDGVRRWILLQARVSAASGD